MASKKPKPGIDQAIEFAKGQRPLARLVGLSKSYINKMHHSGIVPAEQCRAIHDATGVPLYQLNPKIYAKTDA